MVENNIVHEMDGHSIGLAAITFLSFVLSQITLSQVAIVATILAGLSTTAYNIYKIIKKK